MVSANRTSSRVDFKSARQGRKGPMNVREYMMEALDANGVSTLTAQTPNPKIVSGLAVRFRT